MITASQLLKGIMDYLNTKNLHDQTKVPVVNHVSVEQGPPYIQIHLPVVKQNVVQRIITAEMNVRIVSVHRGDSELQNLREQFISHATMFTVTLDDQLYSLQGRLDKIEYSTINDGRTHIQILRFSMFAVKT